MQCQTAPRWEPKLWVTEGKLSQTSDPRTGLPFLPLMCLHGVFHEHLHVFDLIAFLVCHFSLWLENNPLSLLPAVRVQTKQSQPKVETPLFKTKRMLSSNESHTALGDPTFPSLKPVKRNEPPVMFSRGPGCDSSACQRGAPGKPNFCWAIALICCCFLGLKSQTNPGPCTNVFSVCSLWQHRPTSPSFPMWFPASDRAELCSHPPQPISTSFPRAAGIFYGLFPTRWQNTSRFGQHHQRHKTRQEQRFFFAVLTQSEQFSPCLQSCPPKTAWIRVFEKLILLQYCLGFVLLAFLLHHYYNFLFELTCQIFNRFVNKNGPSSPRFCCCWELFAAVSCSLKTEFQWFQGLQGNEGEDVKFDFLILQLLPWVTSPTGRRMWVSAVRASSRELRTAWGEPWHLPCLGEREPLQIYGR